ncbi:hypothetical protein evm_004826 [Chilo suppressalis]|nr:hypothetical protein evm_004826 [Chilo suppressalis]
MKVDSGEGLPDRLEDDAVLVISNPVEARLPSAQISVKLLRDILEKRAQAARIMPATRRPSILQNKRQMEPTEHAMRATKAKNQVEV